jgi:SAM-dependent methyltransferase
VAGLAPGVAIDVGAAGGGNTRVLQGLGWKVAAIEYGEEGSRVAAERGLPTLRADATRLPVASSSLDLVVAFDVLEHIEDDKAAATGVYEALRPGGTFLVAVPADPRLWSAHDDAVGHVRRYTRQTLTDLLASAGFRLDSVRSWNVLLRPAVAMRRRSSTGSDLEEMPGWLNTALYGVVAAERYLPVGSLPGVSLLVTARRV